MKKAVLALLLLVGLFVASWWNIRYLDRFTEDMCRQVERSRAFSHAENFSAAEAELRRALEEWQEAKNYSYIFIRHAEVDAVSDAFYQVLIELGARDADAADGAYDLLCDHLRCIASMEHVNMGTVF